MTRLNRREFVAFGSLPLVVPLMMPTTADAAAKTQTQTASDPVLDELTASMRDLKAEIDAQPSKAGKARVIQGQLRTMEALTGTLAAHIGGKYDAELRRQGKKAEGKRGRAGLIADLQVIAPNVSYSTADAAITEALTTGVSSRLREVQRTLRQARQQGVGIQQAAFVTTQWSYCEDLQWQCDLIEAEMAFVCAMVLVMPILEPVCMALGIWFAALKSAQYVCQWWR